MLNFHLLMQADLGQMLLRLWPKKSLIVLLLRISRFVLVERWWAA